METVAMNRDSSQSHGKQRCTLTFKEKQRVLAHLAAARPRYEVTLFDSWDDVVSTLFAETGIRLTKDVIVGAMRDGEVPWRFTVRRKKSVSKRPSTASITQLEAEIATLKEQSSYWSRSMRRHRPSTDTQSVPLPKAANGLQLIAERVSRNANWRAEMMAVSLNEVMFGMGMLAGTFAASGRISEDELVAISMVMAYAKSPDDIVELLEIYTNARGLDGTQG